ncbi:hypothetical protein [Bradyrhizobium sp. CCGUVB14]|uniref:hypothetical protein n=1 Tax=Bradyrhizobium sp. CCGUVB14 TaxID=2949628 RepID=UPI0020B19555|nr:hypothetical protein [Bradyrhizobium sp. CCGUVB14]MCP3447355.1 hypothetical protein [Bradyrhizobium sp. CCGUVB14]
MIAFRDIKAEARENAILMTNPASAGVRPPAIVTRGQSRALPEAEPEGVSHIDPWMEEAFEALTTSVLTREPFMLLPCTVNGERTAAIVHVSHVEERAHRTHVTPLFVAMTPGMVLIDQKGRRAGSGGSPADDGDAPAPS